MSRQFKPQIPAIGFVGMIFAPIGLVFVIIGLGAAHAIRSGTAQINGSPTTFKWVFFGVGALLLVLGLIFCGAGYSAVRAQKRAFERGRCYTAEFVRVEPDLHVTVNGRHPYIAVLRYTDDFGMQHEVRADAGMKDPTARLSGMQTPVYVDPENSEKYYVDLRGAL